MVPYHRKTLPLTGLLYAIAHKKGTYSHKVFIPRASSGSFTHAQSNGPVHTSYWVRDRFIQRALIANNRSMDDLDTIHRRWHIANHPLFPFVVDNLVKTIEIPALGKESIPKFLQIVQKPDKPRDEVAVCPPSPEKTPSSQQQKSEIQLVNIPLSKHMQND